MLEFTFSFSDLLLLLFGVILGVILGSYIVINKKKKIVLKKINSKVCYKNDNLTNEVNNIVNNITSYHIKSRKDKVILFNGFITINKKVDYEKLSNYYLSSKYKSSEKLNLIDELKYIIDNIASLYFPNSTMPLYELNIEQVFCMLYELLDFSNDLFDSLGIPNIKEVNLCKLFEIAKASKKLFDTYNSKGVRMTVATINTFFMIQSLLSPIYWIRRGSNKLSIDSFSSFIYGVLFEIVAKEAAIIYAKTKEI